MWDRILFAHHHLWRWHLDFIHVRVCTFHVRILCKSRCHCIIHRQLLSFNSFLTIFQYLLKALCFNFNSSRLFNHLSWVIRGLTLYYWWVCSVFPDRCHLRCRLLNFSILTIQSLLLKNRALQSQVSQNIKALLFKSRFAVVFDDVSSEIFGHVPGDFVKLVFLFFFNALANCFDDLVLQFQRQVLLHPVF